MTRIYKYPLPLCDELDIRMPVGARILSVQAQQDVICIWALVDPSAPTEMRNFRIFGTGCDVNNSALTFLGTVQVVGGVLVWHIFEHGAPKA